MAAFKTKYGGIDIELIKTDKNGTQTYEMYNSHDDEYYGWLEVERGQYITDKMVEKAIDNHRKDLFKS